MTGMEEAVPRGTWFEAEAALASFIQEIAVSMGLSDCSTFIPKSGKLAECVEKDFLGGGVDVAGCQEEVSWKRDGPLPSPPLTAGHPGDATAVTLWPRAEPNRGGERGVFKGVFGGTLGGSGDAKVKGLVVARGGSEEVSKSGRVLRKVLALRTVMVGFSLAKARSSSSLALFPSLLPLPVWAKNLPSLPLVSRGTPSSGLPSSLEARLPSKGTGV